MGRSTRSESPASLLSWTLTVREAVSEFEFGCCCFAARIAWRDLSSSSIGECRNIP
jgi:hypothetical protein